MPNSVTLEKQKNMDNRVAIIRSSVQVPANDSLSGQHNDATYMVGIHNMYMLKLKKCVCEKMRHKCIQK